MPFTTSATTSCGLLPCKTRNSLAARVKSPSLQPPMSRLSAGQIDSAATPGAPNLMPDFITKFAFDPGKHFHFEAGGLSTSAKITIVPSVPAATFVKHTKIEGGIFAATNIELFKGFRFLASGMWGPGVGRYLIGMAPQVVVVPVQPPARHAVHLAVAMLRFHLSIPATLSPVLKPRPARRRCLAFMLEQCTPSATAF